MTGRFHAIVGLPRSGKTTFLAALWHLITAGEIESKLILERLVGDHGYLNSIAEAWRRCEPVPRTSMAAEQRVSIQARDQATNSTFTLGFPDLSGETFQRQFSSRSCTLEYIADCNEACGVLLFLNADRGSDGTTIVDLMPAIGGRDDTADLSTPRDWSPDMAPEQARLVDLLQFLQRPPFQRKHRRLAVAISAWDVVLATGGRLSPDQWLTRETPFLAQFLATNADQFEVRVYGVSAQGGDVEGADRERLLAKTASERIECFGPDTEPHDLTAPIVWLNGDR